MEITEDKENKLIYDKNYYSYLLKYERDATLLTYIEKNSPEESWDYQINLMFEYPYFANKILDDYEMFNEQKQERLLNFFSYGKSKILGIFGARGSGKTGDASWIINELYKRHLHKTIYWVKELEETDKQQFPNWINIISDVEETINNSLVVVDETSIKYSARNFWKDENKDFISRLIILRHKNTSIILISQHPMLIDKNIRRLLDIIIYKKGASLIHKDERIDDEKVRIRQRLMPKDFDESLIEYESSYFKLIHDLPDWWSDYVGKAFKNFKPEEKTRKYFQKLNKERFEQEKELEFAKLEKMKELGLNQAKVNEINKDEDLLS